MANKKINIATASLISTAPHIFTRRNYHKEPNELEGQNNHQPRKETEHITNK